MLTGLITLFLYLPGVTQAQQMDINTYVRDHKTLVNILAETYGIPYSVIMGVAIVESSAGTCDAAKVLNNHFGMAGKNEFVNRYGHKSRYKQYDNEIESFIDFCLLVSGRKFYKKLKGKKDPRLWLLAISRSGYSEEPEMWQQKIQHTIRANHLN
jgi:uncharacterized FlgJ-related protein